LFPIRVSDEIRLIAADLWYTKSALEIELLDIPQALAFAHLPNNRYFIPASNQQIGKTKQWNKEL
jgi:hypothetical protein